MAHAARIRRTPWGWCVALLVLSLAAGGRVTLAADGGPPSSLLFGTVEFKGPITQLPKWTGVLDKMKGWKGFFEDPSMAGVPARQSWQALKGEIASAPPMDRVKAVNKYFNQWPYRLDQANFGQSDYWATPPEFMKKSGDCEDYSIAKFYALKELGFTGDDMRIVALRDTIRNIGHAVLVVYLDGDAYVLDNQTVMVLSHAKYKHYLPQYSVNERFRWMHVPPTGNTTYTKPKK
ncbi:MAG: transglutaminase-like cysteine peptidase [Pseudomonadota bacterium]